MNLLDKNDIMNSYAASYAPAGGDEILYFGLERNGNEGAANVGFWFLQDPTIACNAPGGGNFQFTGNHEDGDLLVVSQFTNGGTVSTIEVFEWQGGANGCIDARTRLGPATGCRSPAAPTVERRVRRSTMRRARPSTPRTIAITPWTTVEKTTVGHSLFANEFFEGGINLTDTGLGGKCFNTFLANTRASQELGANLHDFSVGSLGGCTANVTTTPKDGAGNNIPAGGLSIGTGSVEVKDSATIEVTGATVWEGSLQFSLCGPIAAPATCATNGVEIGAAIDVSNTTTQPILSDAATVTSAGRYCWRADFTSETDGVPDDSDSSLGECFIVNPVTPTLTTTAGPDVLLGQPITDTANLTGTANRPGTPVINPTTPGGPAGGSITFSLFGPSDTGCGPLVATLSPATPVSGDGTYGPVSFTPTAVGTYHWVASYSGDPPNTNADDHNLDCSDPTEDVAVISVPSSLFSRQSFIPNDSATVSATTGREPGRHREFRGLREQRLLRDGDLQPECPGQRWVAADRVHDQHHGLHDRRERVLADQLRQHQPCAARHSGQLPGEDCARHRQRRNHQQPSDSINANPVLAERGPALAGPLRFRQPVARKLHAERRVA